MNSVPRRTYFRDQISDIEVCGVVPCLVYLDKSLFFDLLQKICSHHGIYLQATLRSHSGATGILIRSLTVARLASTRLPLSTLNGSSGNWKETRYVICDEG